MGGGDVFLVVAVAPRLLWAGMLGNLVIIGRWAWTRTMGIPVFGPHAGEVETIGAIAVGSKISEALLIAGLVLLRPGTGWASPASEGAPQQRSAEIHPTVDRDVRRRPAAAGAVDAKGGRRVAMMKPANDDQRRRALGLAVLGVLAILLGLTLLWLARVP